MKKLTFIFIALSSTALLSAAQGDQNRNYYKYDSTTSIKQTPRTITDDEIAKNVHSILEGNWLTGGYPNVTFDVNNGTVNLRGVVDTKEEKAKIEQSIKKLEGVKTINTDITVGLKSSQPNKAPLAYNNTKHSSNSATLTTQKNGLKDIGGTDKDHIINAKIRERISKWSPKGYETIVITTSNGSVTITGFAERVEDLQKISNDVKNVEGVKSISNQISIKRI